MERPTDPPAEPGDRASRVHFRPENRLVRAFQYERAFKEGRMARGRHVVAYAHTVDGEPSRAGIIASKKVGDAVHRNKAKRRLRSIVRAVWPRVLPDGRQVVLIALPDVPTVDFEKLTTDVTRLMQDLGVLKP